MKIMQWSVDFGEPASVYRIDDPEDGKRFFRDLQNNAETDGRECFRIIEMDEDEWASAEKLGEELS